MSTEQQQHQNHEQNALAIRLKGIWDGFKQGKIIGYKVMALLLIVVAAVGSLIYIYYERNKANSALWVSFATADSLTQLEEIAKSNPGTVQERLAKLQIARFLLGVAGIDQMSSNNAEQRKKAIENIEKARESFQALLPEVNGDPLLTAICYLGLAKAEASLVAVPAKEGQLTEFKGTTEKAVEWLDKLEGVAKGTPWGDEAKKLADTIRDSKSASAHEFVTVERELFKPLGFPGDPFSTPTSPGPFGTIPGVPFPVLPKGPTPGQPLPTPPTPKAPEPKEPPKPQAKGPDATQPGPIAPAPKTPDSKDAKQPTSPGPIQPTPPGPVPPGPKPPEKK